MNWLNFLGYAASATVFATFCMKTMIPLRILAIASNVLFCSYGYFDHIYPVLILHLALLPINTVRLIQIQRLIREIRTAGHGEIAIESLLPFMTPKSYKAGDMLIRKGEKADRMFYLADGTVEIVEVGKKMWAGAVMGEVGLFARDQRRTASCQVPDRLPCLRSEREQGQGTLFSRPPVRLCDAATHHWPHVGEYAKKPATHLRSRRNVLTLRLPLFLLELGAGAAVGSTSVVRDAICNIEAAQCLS